MGESRETRNQRKCSIWPEISDHKVDEDGRVTVASRSGWNTLPVLMYHFVSAVGGPMRDLAVPALLDEQLSAPTAAGYRLVGLTEALDLLVAGSTTHTHPGWR